MSFIAAIDITDSRPFEQLKSTVQRALNAPDMPRDDTGDFEECEAYTIRLAGLRLSILRSWPTDTSDDIAPEDAQEELDAMWEGVHAQFFVRFESLLFSGDLPELSEYYAQILRAAGVECHPQRFEGLE